jgi:hypothetical protein
MSFNPRNLISQQEIVDSTNSNSTSNPLSANQGFILNSKIVDIENELGQIINKSILPVSDQTIIGLNNIGQLNWDDTNDQVTLSLTNSTFISFTVYNNTEKRFGSDFSSISDAGTFSVSSGNTYNFSEDGTLNTDFNMNDGTFTNVVIFFEPTGSNTAYNLSLNIIRADLVGLVTITGRLISFTSPNTYEDISLRCEASGEWNANLTSPIFPCSWGDAEINNGNQGSGVILPEKVVIKDYSIDLNGQSAVTEVVFSLYENGEIIENTEMVIPATSGLSFGSFNIPPTFEAGKRLNIGIQVGDGDTTYYTGNIILYGTIEEENN